MIMPMLNSGRDVRLPATATAAIVRRRLAVGDRCRAAAPDDCLCCSARLAPEPGAQRGCSITAKWGQRDSSDDGRRAGRISFVLDFGDGNDDDHPRLTGRPGFEAASPSDYRRRLSNSTIGTGTCVAPVFLGCGDGHPFGARRVGAFTARRNSRSGRRPQASGTCRADCRRW